MSVRPCPSGNQPTAANNAMKTRGPDPDRSPFGPDLAVRSEGRTQSFSYRLYTQPATVPSSKRRSPTQNKTVVAAAQGSNATGSGSSLRW